MHDSPSYDHEIPPVYDVAPDASDYSVAHDDAYSDTGLLPDRVADEIIARPTDAAEVPNDPYEGISYGELGHPALEEALEKTEKYGTLTDIFAQQLFGSPTAWSLDHLQLLPNDDSVVIRTCPAPHHPPLHLTPEKAETLIEGIRIHHAVLAGTPKEPGMTIPHTVYQAETNPAGETYIIGITERVYGERIRGDRHDRASIAPHLEEAAIHLAEIEINYYGWIIDTQQEYFIPDMGNPDQCLVANGTELILTDTDPLLIRFATATGMGDFSDSLSDMKMWIEQLPPSDARTTLLEKQQTLYDTYLQLFNELLPHVPQNDGPEHVTLTDQVVRLTPGPYHYREPYGNAEDAGRDAQIALTHHDLLAGDDPTTGIVMPFVSYEPYNGGEDKFYIMSSATQVEGVPFSDYSRWQKIGLGDQEKDAAATLAMSLYDYYTHLYEGRMTTALADIAKPSKFSITPDGRPALLDTDPVILDLTTLQGQDALLADLDGLGEWSVHASLTIKRAVADLKQLFKAEFVYTAGRPPDNNETPGFSDELL